jgi:hypothetical protein
MYNEYYEATAIKAAETLQQYHGGPSFLSIKRATAAISGNTNQKYYSAI